MIFRFCAFKDVALGCAATSFILGVCRLRVDIPLDCFVSRSCGILAITIKNLIMKSFYFSQLPDLGNDYLVRCS